MVSAAAGALVVLGFVAYSGAGAPAAVAVVVPAGASATIHAPASARTVKVYFLKGEQFFAVTRVVPAGTSLASGALQALLAGPTAAETAAGIRTTLPDDMDQESLSVKAGLASVVLTRGDLQTGGTLFDDSLAPARAAQIAYTLTAVAGVKRVSIHVDGVDLSQFEGSSLAADGSINRHDLAPPGSPPAMRVGKPDQPAPADPRLVQMRLVALRYLPADAVTGKWDYRTSQAVTAFQAWQGLLRDGVVGPQTLAALKTASPPRPAAAHTGHSIEVYRAKGVTLLIDGSQLVRAIHSSSGAPGFETPSGSYTVFRKELSSWSVPYRVWLPYASYFNGGDAFHAYENVPAYPASHGCVRLPVPEAPYVYAFAANGTPVTVY
jgi:lipoprotein-anchoring transpeptidase ErfK/SrfK